MEKDENDKKDEKLFGSRFIENYIASAVSSVLVGLIWWFGGGIMDYPQGVKMKDVNNDGYLDCIVSQKVGSDQIFYGNSRGVYSSLEDLEKENNQIIQNAEEQMRLDFMNKYGPLENKVQ
jgi:hypothetical protein